MALTTNQLIVGMFNMASGGYNTLVSDYITANGDVAAADALLQFTGLNPQFAGANLYSDAEFASAVVARVMPGLSTSLQASITSIVTNFITANPALSRGAVVVALINAVDAIPASDPVLGTAGAAFDSRVALADASTSTSVDFTELQTEVGGSAIVPGSTFTLTNSTDNLSGTTGDDTFIGDNVSTSAGDTLTGGAGTDTLKLFGAATKPSFTGIEKVYLNGNAAGFDVSTNADVTTLDLDDVATAQTYTITNGQAVSVANMAATEVVDFAGNTVTALSVGLNGLGSAAGANDVQIDLNSTAQTEVSFTTSTKKSFVELLNTGAKLTTVNIAGDQVLSLESALTTVTTINAATATGDVTIAGVGASNLTFTGGTGNDKLVAAATITGSDVFKGGAGTDTLSVSDADTVDTAAEVIGITEFEIFEAAGVDGTAYDLSVIGAKNTLSGLVVSATGGNATVTNLNAATAGNITINGDAPATITLTASDFVSGGTSDTASIKIDNSVTKAADGVDITSLVFANADVLNLESKGDGTSTKTVGGAEENSVILTATDVEKVVITGDEALAFSTALGTNPTEVDASGLTNSAAVTVDTDASAITSILVKGTAKNDTIDIDNAATVTSTLYLGGGSDTVVVDGGGTSAHTLIYTATALNAGDLKAGDSSVITLTGAGAGDVVTINLSSALEGLLKSGSTLLSATSANINIHGTTISATTNIAASQAAGNMDLQFDLNGDGTFSATDDAQIRIVGTLADDTLVYNAATDVLTFTVV
jgi:hypothetical protein